MKYRIDRALPLPLKPSGRTVHRRCILCGDPAGYICQLTSLDNGRILSVVYCDTHYTESKRVFA